MAAIDEVWQTGYQAARSPWQEALGERRQHVRVGSRHSTAPGSVGSRATPPHSRIGSDWFNWTPKRRQVRTPIWRLAVDDGTSYGVCGTMVTMDTNLNDLPPQASRLAPPLRVLADHGVYFGTSSWKYEGWIGSIYSGDRYVTSGKFSKSKFEENCLAEYAQTFPTVCGDLTFYQFPTEAYWAKLFDGTPEQFHLRLQGPRGHHGIDLAQTRSVRQTGGPRQRALLECASPRAILHQPAQALWPPGRTAHLRVRDV